MKRFAIRLKDTNLYYNNKTKYFECLNPETRFYTRMDDAMRVIEGVVNEATKQVDKHFVYDLVWRCLERRYHEDRWNMNPDMKVFNKVLDIISKLEVVPIEIEFYKG